MVLLFAASFTIFELRMLPWIWVETADTLTNMRFLPYLMYSLEIQILWPAAILAGGLWGASPRSEQKSQSQPVN